MRSAPGEASLALEAGFGPSGFHILGVPPGASGPNTPISGPVGYRNTSFKRGFFQWEASELGRSHSLRASLLWLSLISVRMPTLVRRAPDRRPPPYRSRRPPHPPPDE